ncbi:MAG TPA: Fur family transcriptional regulator [Candidatus Dormibacteraeota bacterium]|nr:Fur family transcriptional regulator [Candidatus Dormibacteraeota bacterium]
MDGLEALREQGKRLTPQRRLVFSALLESPGHATADELCTSISHKVPGFQRTTVYRTLDLLVELGLARKVQLGHVNAYEAVQAGNESHQHLLCDRCGATFDVSAPEVPEWVERAAAKIGFNVERVELVGHGSCSGCGRPYPGLGAPSLAG